MSFITCSNYFLDAGGFGSASITWDWNKIQDMALKIYSRVAKGLKPKVTKFWRVIPTFEEVREEKLIGGAFFLPLS